MNRTEDSDSRGSDRSVVPTSEIVSDCISELNEVVESQLRLMGALIGTIMGLPKFEPPEKKVEGNIGAVIVPLCQGAGSSIAAMQAFPEPGLRTRECYLMARSVVESLINCCYIIAEGPPAANAAMRHARQKSFRDLDRQSEIGGNKIRIGLKNKPNVADIEGLAEDLAEFTLKSGKEDVRWTTASVDEGIRIAGEKFGESVLTRLHMARFSVYRHSSEIIHGTLFGYLFFHGATMRSDELSSQQKLAEHIGGQHIYLLLSVVLVTSAFILAFDKAYGIDKINKDAKDLVHKVREIAYFKVEGKNSPTGDGDDADQ